MKRKVPLLQHKKADRSKHHANNNTFQNLLLQHTYGETSCKKQNTNENNHGDLFRVAGKDEAKNTMETSLQDNHLSQKKGYDETSTKPAVFTTQTTDKTEQAVSEDFMPCHKLFYNTHA